jgi:hypothetical protein
VLLVLRRDPGCDGFEGGRYDEWGDEFRGPGLDADDFLAGFAFDPPVLREGGEVGEAEEVEVGE